MKRPEHLNQPDPCGDSQYQTNLTMISDGNDFMSTKNEKVIFSIFFITISALIVSIIMLSWVPPVSRDALTHHLAVPNIYLERGGIVELPDIPFSYYPMNLDLLYMIPLYFGNDILPKIFHFFFGLLTAGILFGYIYKRLGIGYAMFGVLFFLSLPVIIKLSITVYVDLGLVFFSTAALITLINWGKNHSKYRYFLLSAVFCGLALGTKYNGLVTLFILMLFVPVIYLRQASERSARQISAVGLSVVYLILSLTVFAPWLVRNTVWTGNPIYPLYNKYFSVKQTLPSDEISLEVKEEIKKRTQGWNQIAIRRIIYGESWGQIALIPVRIFFQGKDDKPQYFDGKLNPFLLFLTLLAFIPTQDMKPIWRFERNIFFIYVILFILISFFRTSIRIRYIAPVIPPLIILSCFGLKNIISFFQMRKYPHSIRMGKTAVIIGVILLFWMNAAYLVDLFKKIDPLSYLSGRVGRDEYITKHRPEYPVFKYANQNLTESDQILGLYIGNRRYYCDRTLIFGENLFTRTIILASSAEDVRMSLRKQGYTHIIAHLNLLKKWSRSLDEEERRIAADFFNNDNVLIKQNQEYVLLALNSHAR